MAKRTKKDVDREAKEVAKKEKTRRDLWLKLAKDTIDGATGLDDIGPTMYVTEIYGKDGEPIDDEEAIEFISSVIEDEIVRRWDAYEDLTHQNGKLKLKMKELRSKLRTAYLERPSR